MKADSPDIDKQCLLQLLRLRYNLDIDRLVFVPKGEESYGYRAKARTGSHYFVKVHTSIDGYDGQCLARLQMPYQIAYQLQEQSRLAYVVAPLVTLEHEVLCNWGKYAVAVFPYIEGNDLDGSTCTMQECAQIAVLVATFHDDTRDLSLLDCPEEDFAISFKDWLHQVMAAVDEPVMPENEYRRQARDLLSKNKELILAWLQDLETAGERVKTCQYERVLTHGDLASGNIIRTGDERLSIIDWGKVLRAPAERDLVSFWDTDFDQFLDIYQAQRHSAFHLSIDAFEYYLYESILAQVADYGSWLLLEDASPDELDHAWRKLEKCVWMGRHDMQLRLVRLRSLVQP